MTIARPKTRGRGASDGGHRRPVAQMQVPVVRAGEGQRRRGGRGHGHGKALFFLDYTVPGGASAGAAGGAGARRLVADAVRAL